VVAGTGWFSDYHVWIIIVTTAQIIALGSLAWGEPFVPFTISNFARDRSLVSQRLYQDIISKSKHQNDRFLLHG
jgi:hypothetical protein